MYIIILEGGRNWKRQEDYNKLHYDAHHKGYGAMEGRIRHDVDAQRLKA